METLIRPVTRLNEQLATDSSTTTSSSSTILETDTHVLKNIEQRMLWLSTLMIHYANNVRPNPDKTKVGGHQASAASSVSIITALYFHFLRSGDRMMMKPHAAPALHAALYLMGLLDKKYLTMLRQFGGLQSYPSRTKDPFQVDFAAGSMGLGTATPIFAALTSEYVKAHFGASTADRFVAIVGDAELDEGNLWEMLIDDTLRANLRNAIFIVDYNRQSLDRVLTGVRATKLKALFEACNWNVLECKYGSQLREVFARPGGEALRLCIDDMGNEEYQSLIRSEPAAIRASLARHENGSSITQCISTIPDEELAGVISNLGGHDIPDLIRALETAAHEDGPSVIFAYTIKGYDLPLAGDPSNHAALLSGDRLNTVRARFGLTEEMQWDAFEPDTAEAEWCKLRAEALHREPVAPPAVQADEVPLEINALSSAAGSMSTQEAFGRIMLRLADVPKIGERIITTSADVSVSTNLGGWINKVGAFALKESTDYEEGRNRTLNWHPSARGQHVEFGIAEMNLFTALGAFGLSHEHNGELLFPIGTVYDPFVARALEAIIHGTYSGSKFIFAATPSGVTLAPEGGAHQSIVTASAGIETPELDLWEPCFGLETEWAMLEGIRQCCDREHGRSTYLRLSTKPIDQSLMKLALERLGKDELRRQMMLGGYVIRDGGRRTTDDSFPSSVVGRPPSLHLITTGTMIPECLRAAEYLEQEGVAVNVIHLVSPGRAYRNREHLASLISAELQDAPILTVHDAASHALAWVGGIYGQRTRSLGVDKFGQSGYREDLYRYMHIDVDSIIAAGFELVDGGW